MWQAIATAETRPDVPHNDNPLNRRRPGWLWSQFLVVGALVAGGGWLVTVAAESLVEIIGPGDRHRQRRRPPRGGATPPT